MWKTQPVHFATSKINDWWIFVAYETDLLKNQSNIASQNWIALRTATVNCIYDIETTGPVRARHSVGFLTRHATKKLHHQQHLIVIVLADTCALRGDDGSTKSQLVATNRNNKLTASLEKRKMLGRKRGT